MPPHSDFEQGTGHYHEEQEEIYVVTRGTLTRKLDRQDAVKIDEFWEASPDAAQERAG